MTVLDESMGCMLGQHDDSEKRERAVYYLSKKFTACEMNYSLLERTCCALVWASHLLRQYMLSHTTWLVSKMDLVKYIFEKPTLTGWIARWQVLLSKFHIVHVTQKAIEGSTLADYLAQQPLNNYQPMHPEFPDEDIMVLFEEKVEDEDMEKWIVWFDDASNVLGDGLRGERETRDHKLIPYQAYIKKLVEFFDEVSFHHAPKEENQMVDALATLASMFRLTPHGDLPYIEIRCRG
ncbi:uncharacterized protein LOC114410769 [Glycine soja]|uniref:uncharacterized protein LOC114410769 n=1 Tax=Glycine soja TaxID=3848 RepID=UPI001038AAC0|nr:uncharacterized protein LOC114410769 [Glycine soja]